MAEISNNLNYSKGVENDHRKLYITEQYQDGQWGGTDILIAAAEFYHLNVNVYKRYNISIQPITFIPKNNHAVNSISATFNGNHYDSLVYGRNSYYLPTQYTSDNTPEEQPDDTGLRLIQTTVLYKTTAVALFRYKCGLYDEEYTNTQKCGRTNIKMYVILDKMEN